MAALSLAGPGMALRGSAALNRAAFAVVASADRAFVLAVVLQRSMTAPHDKGRLVRESAQLGNPYYVVILN